MRTIRKEFKTLRAAEAYQNRLYSRFDSVQLVAWPRFEESGVYAWKVA